MYIGRAAALDEVYVAVAVAIGWEILIGAILGVHPTELTGPAPGNYAADSQGKSTC